MRTSATPDFTNRPAASVTEDDNRGRAHAMAQAVGGFIGCVGVLVALSIVIGSR